MYGSEKVVQHACGVCRSVRHTLSVSYVMNNMNTSVLS